MMKIKIEYFRVLEENPLKYIPKMINANANEKHIIF